MVAPLFFLAHDTPPPLAVWALFRQRPSGRPRSDGARFLSFLIEFLDQLRGLPFCASCCHTSMPWQGQR